MPRSDRTSHDDALAREVVRQLADAAPPVPPWEAVAPEPSRSPARRWPNSPQRTLVMAAALVVVAIGGLVIVGQRRATEPPSFPVLTLPPPTSAAIAEWLETADPAEIQVCLAGSTLRLGRSMESGPLDDELDLPGVTPERAELAGSTSSIVVLQAALESGELDAATAALVTPVVDAWSAADEVVGDPASTPVERRAALARFDEVRDMYLAAPSTVDCVFDASDVSAAFEAASVRLGSLALARCVSALGLDQALQDVAGRRESSDVARLEAALSGLAVWDNRPDPSQLELLEAVTAVRDAEPGARTSLVQRARTELDQLDELASCPTWTDPTVLDPD